MRRVASLYRRPADNFRRAAVTTCQHRTEETIKRGALVRGEGERANSAEVSHIHGIQRAHTRRVKKKWLRPPRKSAHSEQRERAAFRSCRDARRGSRLRERRSGSEQRFAAAAAAAAASTHASDRDDIVRRRVDSECDVLSVLQRGTMQNASFWPAGSRNKQHGDETWTEK